MADIQQIKSGGMLSSFGPVYEKLLATLGTAEFGTTVRDSIFSVTAGARRLYLFEATGRMENRLQYCFCEPGVEKLFPLYSKSYLPLDPIYDVYQATPWCSDIAFQRIRPADIRSAGFRRRFFEEPGIVERLSIVQRGPDSWRAMSVARHVSEGCFSEDEIGALINLSWLVLPMLPLNRDRQGTALQLTAVQLEERFAARFPALTRRECEVCARAAIGMTVEGTALDLAIGKRSVLTYRQRAYGRLGISSPFQLCSLVSH